MYSLRFTKHISATRHRIDSNSWIFQAIRQHLLSQDSHEDPTKTYFPHGPLYQPTTNPNPLPPIRSFPHD